MPPLLWGLAAFFLLTAASDAVRAPEAPAEGAERGEAEGAPPETLSRTVSVATVNGQLRVQEKVVRCIGGDCAVSDLSAPGGAGGQHLRGRGPGAPGTLLGPELVDLFPAGRVPGTPAAPGPMEEYAAASSDLRCGGAGPRGGHEFRGVSEPALLPFVLDSGDAQRSGAGAVVVPGGTCGSLAWEREGTEIALWLNSIGVSAFVLKRRTSCSSSSPAIDAQRAMRLVRANAPCLGLNASRIGAVGFGVGAGLVIDLSINEEVLYAQVDEADDVSFRPDFILALYPSMIRNLTDHVMRVPNIYFAFSDDDACVDWEPVTEFYVARKTAFVGQKRTETPATELHVFWNNATDVGRCTLYPDKWYPLCQWPSSARWFIIDTVLLQGKWLPLNRLAEGAPAAYAYAAR